MCNQDARAPLGRCRLLLTSTPCRGSCAFAWLWQPSITKDVLPVSATLKHFLFRIRLGRIPIARLAQSAERKALNLVVVGSSPTVGVLCGSPRPGALGNAKTMIHSRVIGMGGGTGIGQVLPVRCNIMSKSEWKDTSVPSMLGLILAWIWSACRV